MKNTKLKVALLFLALGFIFIVLDVEVATGLDYPNKYQNTDKLSGEYQYYNIRTNYGATCTYKMIDDKKYASEKEFESKPIETHNPKSSDGEQAKSKTVTIKVIDDVYYNGIHIDVLPDILGFIFIIIGCLLLKKCSRRFGLTILTALGGLIICALLYSLPFFMNGVMLCHAAFIIGFVYMFANIFTLYLAMTSLLAMIPGVVCRDERKWSKITWVGMLATFIVATFTHWLGADFGMLYTLSNIGYAILLFLIILFWYILLRARHYINKSYIEAYSK